MPASSGAPSAIGVALDVRSARSEAPPPQSFSEEVVSRYVADLAIDAVAGAEADTSASVLNEERFVESVESLEMSKNGARIGLDRHARNAETQLASTETMTSWPRVTARQFVRDG